MAQKTLENMVHMLQFDLQYLSYDIGNRKPACSSAKNLFFWGGSTAIKVKTTDLGTLTNPGPDLHDHMIRSTDAQCIMLYSELRHVVTCMHALALLLQSALSFNQAKQRRHSAKHSMQ